MKALAIPKPLLLLLLTRFAVENSKFEFLDPLMLVKFKQFVLDFRVLDLLEPLQLKAKNMVLFSVETKKNGKRGLRSRWD